jgi:hypothetical protein
MGYLSAEKITGEGSRRANQVGPSDPKGGLWLNARSNQAGLRICPFGFHSRPDSIIATRLRHCIVHVTGAMAPPGEVEGLATVPDGNVAETARLEDQLLHERAVNM